MAQTTFLTHALDLVGRPVVTFAGDDIAQVRDILFEPNGDVRGFTLAGRGLLSGPKRKWLPIKNVHAVGPDVIIVGSEDRLASPEKDNSGGKVETNEVMTTSGRVIGTVMDAILRLEPDLVDVVGYQVKPTDGTDPHFVPLPDTVAVTSGRLVVPDQAIEFLSSDLTTFGAAVESFRQRLAEGSPAVAPPLEESLSVSPSDETALFEPETSDRDAPDHDSSLSDGSAPDDPASVAEDTGARSPSVSEPLSSPSDIEPADTEQRDTDTSDTEQGDTSPRLESDNVTISEQNDGTKQEAPPVTEEVHSSIRPNDIARVDPSSSVDVDSSVDVEPDETEDVEDPEENDDE